MSRPQSYTPDSGQGQWFPGQAYPGPAQTQPRPPPSGPLGQQAYQQPTTQQIPSRGPSDWQYAGAQQIPNVRPPGGGPPFHAQGPPGGAGPFQSQGPGGGGTPFQPQGAPSAMTRPSGIPPNQPSNAPPIAYNQPGVASAGGGDSFGGWPGHAPGQGGPSGMQPSGPRAPPPGSVPPSSGFVGQPPGAPRPMGPPNGPPMGVNPSLARPLGPPGGPGFGPPGVIRPAGPPTASGNPPFPRPSMPPPAGAPYTFPGNPPGPPPVDYSAPPLAGGPQQGPPSGYAGPPPTGTGPQMMNAGPPGMGASGGGGGPPTFGPPGYAQGQRPGSPVIQAQQQFQGMSLGGQPVGHTSGPPVRPPVGATAVGGPPTWQPTTPRRAYPDAYGTGAPSAQAGHQMPGATEQPASPAMRLPSAGPPAWSGVAQATSQAPTSSRIDPQQIPRPQPPPTTVVFETRVNGAANLPPAATSTFVVKDTGNCSPRFMRCTLNQIPGTAELLATSSMPLALIVQPFALQDPSEEPIQVVDFGESGPVRCKSCKGYINRFMKFVDQGRRFICNLCNFTNETPWDYISNLGPDGRRRDADERPELCKGTVEFVAPKEYMVRPPMLAAAFFLIDVSLNAVQTGATAAACGAIQKALGELPDSPVTLVGIATYDSTVHFYNLNPRLSQPTMLVVPDVQNVYTPLPTDLVVPLPEAKENIEQLLDNIPTMFQANRVPDSAFGAALQGAFLALKETGGKILAFQSVLPSMGFGSLAAREAEGRSSGTGNEKEVNKLLQPIDTTFKKMAVDFAEYQVAVDLFLTSQAYVDIASLQVVPRTTGGQLYYYHPFNAATDSAKLYNDLRWNLTRPQGMEAVMRVRCSQGLSVQEYYGNFCKRIPTDVDLPSIDCDKAVMVTLKHEDKFQDGAEVCFQCALLVTTMTGERRIRIHTLSLPVTTVLGNLFRGADLDSQFTYFLKHVAQEVPTKPVTQVKDEVLGHCVSILHTYRKFCATSSSSGQLILPEALKLLPLYTLALNKSVGLRTDARWDERSYWLARAASLSASLSIPFVYPRMFTIHNLPPKAEMAGTILPPVVALSSEKLDHDGMCLLESGEDAYIWVGKGASPDLVSQLFGVPSVDDIVAGQFDLPVLDNPLSQRLNEILNEIRRQRCSYLRLRIIKRGDPMENVFFSFLVEDRSPKGMSYVDFLVHVHRQIQNKMA